MQMMLGSLLEFSFYNEAFNLMDFTLRLNSIQVSEKKLRSLFTAAVAEAFALVIKRKEASSNILA